MKKLMAVSVVMLASFTSQAQARTHSRLNYVAHCVSNGQIPVGTTGTHLIALTLDISVPTLPDQTVAASGDVTVHEVQYVDSAMSEPVSNDTFQMPYTLAPSGEIDFAGGNYLSDFDSELSADRTTYTFQIQPEDAAAPVTLQLPCTVQ